MNEEIELGDKVKDVITGYMGIAVAKTIFINGCIQFSVAKMSKNNELPSDRGDPSIDESSLIILEKGYVDKMKKPKKKETSNNGGATKYLGRMRGY